MATTVRLGRPDPELLDRTVRRVYEVSSLPHIAAQVIAVVNDERASAVDLKKVVESDPSLAARILRTVSSVAYELRVPVNTIHMAVCYLGFNTIRNLAITASVADVFRQNETVGAYNRRQLWRHLVSVAVASELMVSRIGLDDVEESFLAGLLHDLGIILLDQYLHPSFVEIIGALSPDRPLPETEREILGFDHAEFGARVGEKWRFPAGVIDAMRFHHGAERCDTDHKAVVQAVEAANFLCSTRGITATGICNLAPPASATLEALSLDGNRIDSFADGLNEAFSKYQALVEM